MSGLGSQQSDGPAGLEGTEPPEESEGALTHNDDPSLVNQAAESTAWEAEGHSTEVLPGKSPSVERR